MNTNSLASVQDFLLVDPVPGTFVVFPSFLPHFVLPTVATESAVASEEQHAHQRSAQQKPLRLSVAFNFGACDPVDVTMYEQAGKVKVFLEAVEVMGI